MTLGETIRALREAAGLPIEQMARQLDITAQTLAQWEQGEADPTPPQLVQVCQLLQISADSLLAAAQPTTAPDMTPLSQLVRLNFCNRQITMGFRTMVIALSLLVAELLLLPVLGMLQSLQLGSRTLPSGFLRYAAVQPMPLVLLLTCLMLALGGVFLLRGYLQKKKLLME